MFKSLRLRTATTFFLTIFFILIFLFFVSAMFLQRYYVYREELEFAQIYGEITKIAENTEARDVTYTLTRLAANSNIAVIISDAQFSQVYSSTNTFNEFQNSNGAFFNPKSFLGSIEIPEGKAYTIKTLPDQYGMKRIFLKGHLVGDYYIFLTKPVEAIIKSVDVYKDFFLIISVPVSILGAVISYFVSANITKPIYEMVDISNRISKLDFSKKYVPKGESELNTLGLSLNSMSETLSKNITQLYRANTMLKNDITQRERNEVMRKEFLQNASHELKTPIAVIASYGEMLKEGLVTDKEDLDYYYDVICDETDKMAKIVKELLVLAQLESYRDILSIESFDISELAHETAETYEVIAKGEDTTIKTDITDGLTVSADRTLIERVMSNYVSNAIYHCEGEKEILIILKKCEYGVYFAVRNQTTQQLDSKKIWQSFYKDAESKGNGLGLSIVKAIMEVHNKKYGVKCENGYAEFYIIL